MMVLMNICIHSFVNIGSLADCFRKCAVINIGGGGVGGGGGSLQLHSWTEVHFIWAISSKRNIVFPENRCSSLQLDTSQFGQQMSDLGRQCAILNLKPPYTHVYTVCSFSNTCRKPFLKRGE